jgi:dihydrofolate synthase/folylpolyglutamate synthase
MDEEAEQVIAAVAREVGAPLVRVGDRVTVRRIGSGLDGSKVAVETSADSYGTMGLPLVGEHQVENLATAVCAVEVFAEAAGIEIPREAFRKGVSDVQWPGRFQVIEEEPPVIVDGAHNPGAAAALSESLADRLTSRPIGMVLGMCDDKDVAGFLKPFRGLVKRVWAVPINSERSAATSELAAAVRATGCGDVSETTLGLGLDEARQWAREASGAVCVTGSLFLAGEVLDLISKKGQGGPNE